MWLKVPQFRMDGLSKYEGFVRNVQNLQLKASGKN